MEKLYTYKELAELFKEEPKKHSSRVKQLNRWRKEKNIEKVDGKNLYRVTDMLPSQTTSLLKSSARIASNYKFLEPMFMYLLVQAKDNKFYSTYSDLQRELGLVNDAFIKTRFSEENKYVLADSMGVTIKELNDFRQEAYEINYTILKNIIQKMSKLGLLYKQDVFTVEYINENGDVIKDDFTGGRYSRIMEKRNEVSRRNYGKIYALLNADEQEYVKKEINDEYGFIRHKQQFIIYADKESINYCLDKNFNYLMTKYSLNENNQMRILKSKRGELKNLTFIKKNNLVSGIIALKKGN